MKTNSIDKRREEEEQKRKEEDKKREEERKKKKTTKAKTKKSNASTYCSAIFFSAMKEGRSNMKIIKFLKQVRLCNLKSF